MDKKTKDLYERAAWTFAQSFLAVFVVGVTDVFSAFQGGSEAGKAALVALGVSALAAGLSALKTAYLSYKS